MTKLCINMIVLQIFYYYKLKLFSKASDLLALFSVGNDCDYSECSYECILYERL